MEEKNVIMPSGVVAAIRTGSRRRILDVRELCKEPPTQFLVEVHSKYHIEVGDEVRVEGNIAYWTPAGDTVQNIPVPLCPPRPEK